MHKIVFDQKPREAALERWFVATVKKRGGRAYKFTSPGRRSVPDRLVVLPNTIPFFVELKREGKKPTPKQELEINFLEQQGQFVFVADTKVKCLSLLQKMHGHCT